MPPGFDRLESYGHDKPTVKHCYFRCSRPLVVGGIKIFDTMTRLQNIKISHLFFFFLARSVLVLGRSFFTCGVFWLDFTSFLIPHG